MKLLVITMLYEPDCVGIAAMASDMCRGLAERGHDVTVYTAYPYYPEWKLKREVNPWRIEQESLGSVTVRRHGMFIPANPSRLLPRLVHELSFPLSLMRSLFNGRRYDMVMVFCPLLGSVAFAALRKLFYRELLWVNVQDLPAEAGRATGINRSRIVHALGSWVQKFLFRRGEVWSSISPDMVDQLETIKPAATTVHLCPNWLTGSLADQLRQRPGKVNAPPHTPLRLLYCGTIGKKQGLLELCRRLSRFDLDFRFQIQGAGSEAHTVRDWVAGSGDRRFQFGELLPEADFVSAVHQADWFVISETPGAGFSFLPSKLIPSISLGTPVLAIADSTGPLGREVSQATVGLNVPWSQLDQLPDRLRPYQQAPEQFFQLQRNCLRHAEAYDRDAAIDRLQDLLLMHSSPPYRVPETVG